MEKIIVIGCCGSGKSTLSKNLSKLLNIPVVHLDKLWWTKNWQSVSEAEFDEKLKEELDKPKWICDGNFSRTQKYRMSLCDTVIFLDFKTSLCLYRAFKRVLIGRKKVRSDMAEGCAERFDKDFFRFILNFNKRNRKMIYNLLGENTQKNCLVFKNPKQLKRFIAELSEMTR